MGKYNSHDNKICGEISPRKLLRSGLSDPIGVDIFQRVKKKNTGYPFAGVEKLIQETLLPCLFSGKYKSIPTIIGTLSKIPVKKSGLILKNPVMSDNEKCLSSRRACSELIKVMNRKRKFTTSNHPQAVKEEMSDGRKTQDDVNDTKL